MTPIQIYSNTFCATLKQNSSYFIPPQNTLKKLKSFLGSVHYTIKPIPNSAQLCQPLKPLTKKSTKLNWTETYTKHFNVIQRKKQKVLKTVISITNNMLE